MAVNPKLSAQPSKRKQADPNRSFIEPLELRCLLSASVANIVVAPSISLAPAAAPASGVQGYTPAQLKAAYGITGDGAGQTIAIVDAYSDPKIAADLAVFDAQFGLSAPPNFKQVNAAGGAKLPAADAGWASEISLDVEWAHAIAPQANIVLVDAASASLTSLLAAVNYARNLSSTSVVSISWGSSEFASEKTYDSYFTTPVGHTGITFVAASGDEGASGGTEWPASSPNVLSVGGTTLTLTSSGTISSESAWSDSSGGASSYETLAAQSAVTGLTTRNSPDVSFDANPNTGVAVYDSIPYQGYAGWQEIGGTSVGAPAWSAIVAIADAARTAAKTPTLTTAQTLSDVYSIYSNSTTYANDFHDITTGSSVLSQGGGFGGRGGFGWWWGFGFQPTTYVNATTGYDTLTGVGSPKGAGIIAALTSNSTPTATTSTASTTTLAASARRRAAIVRELPMFATNVTALPPNLQELPTTADAAAALPDAGNPPAVETVTRIASPDLHGNGATITSSIGELPSSGSVLADDVYEAGAFSPTFGADAAATLSPQLLSAVDPTDAMGVSVTQPIAPEVSLSSSTLAMSTAKMLPELGQVFRDAVHEVTDDLASISSNLGDINDTAGGLALSLAIANAALLGYCYINRKRQGQAGFEAVFSDGERIGD